MMLEDVDIPARAPVSVLVLTRNEEANIAECLESLRWAAEVLVVDSLSTDRTAEIAEALGAKVCPHAFAGYADQRNWALENLPFAHDWVLMIDADERIPGALAGEIREVVSRSNDTYSGFYISRRLFFMGRWLRHGGLYPTWLLRPFMFFAGNYFGKGGFLDGRAGFIYHVLWSFWARFLTDVKILERQLAGGGPQSNALKGGQPEDPARSKEVMAS